MDDNKKKPISAPYPPDIFTFGDYVREMAQEEEAKRLLAEDMIKPSDIIRPV